MHSRITLILWHHPDHRPPLPDISLHREQGDREVQACFHEADDESSELVGCPECVIHMLRVTADEVEAQLSAGRWADGPLRPAPDA